jgi:hypothetical protein
LFQVAGERLEALVPEAAVAVEPLVGGFERRRHQTQVVDPPVAPAREQARPFEYPQMLGDRGLGHPKRARELGDRGFGAVGQTRDHRAPGRVGERMERGVESGGGRMVNHMVNY